MYFGGNDVTVVVSDRNSSSDPLELDAPTFQFQLTRSKLPIYGYKSTRFDAVANGEELVQGQFILNFKHSAELYYYKTGKIRRQPEAGTDDIIDLHFDRIDIYYTDKKAILDEAFEGFANPKQLNYTLVDVHMQTMGQSITSGGEPVGESYTFIARGISHARQPVEEAPDRPLPEVIPEGDVIVGDLPPADAFGVETLPLIPRGPSVIINYSHRTIPLLWAHEDPGADFVDYTWHPYKGYKDPALVIATSLESESGRIVFASLGALPEASRPSVTGNYRQRSMSHRIDTAKMAAWVRLQPRDAQQFVQTSDSSVQIALHSDFVAIVESADQSAKGVFRASYQRAVSGTLDPHLISSPGVHDILVKDADYSIYHLIQYQSSDGNDRLRWESQWQNLDLGPQSFSSASLTDPDRYFIYSNGEKTYLAAAELDGVISDQNLSDFLREGTILWSEPDWTTPDRTSPYADNTANV